MCWQLKLEISTNQVLTWINFNSCMDNISDNAHYKACDEIFYPFPNLTGAAIEVWEWISNFIPNCAEHVITYPCWG